MATRACEQRSDGVQLESAWTLSIGMPSIGIGAVAFLVAGLVFWVAASGPSQAGPLIEANAPDAQIARRAPDGLGSTREPATIHDHIQSLIVDADQNCISMADRPSKLHDQPRTQTQLELEEAVEAVRQSDVGAWLVQIATARNVTLCLDHATSLEAHYRSHIRLLGLNARLSPAGRIVFLAHELAHVPQHPQFSNNRHFSPRDMLLLQRVREAAAEAVATRVLWQLNRRGIGEPWQEKLNTAYSDIAKTFEMTMSGKDGDAQELWATRSAFHHWFEASWRLAIYDDLMFKMLSRIADDTIGLIPASRHLSDHYLRGIANYAGERFLIGGDGEALIQRFRTESLPANGQARLDAILQRADIVPKPTFSSEVKIEAHSALSPKQAITQLK